MGCIRQDYLDNRKARIKNNLEFLNDKKTKIVGLSKEETKVYKSYRRNDLEAELIVLTMGPTIFDKW